MTGARVPDVIFVRWFELMKAIDDLFHEVGLYTPLCRYVGSMESRYYGGRRV